MIKKENKRRVHEHTETLIFSTPVYTMDNLYDPDGSDHEEVVDGLMEDILPSLFVSTHVVIATAPSCV